MVQYHTSCKQKPSTVHHKFPVPAITLVRSFYQPVPQYRDPCKTTQTHYKGFYTLSLTWSYYTLASLIKLPNKVTKEE